MSANQVKISDFYAEDVFKQWKKLVKKAKSSVVIYSPFVNKTLNDLLEHINESVKVEIITRIDKNSLFGIGGIPQLKALIQASQRIRTSIFELSDLHAKILLVDEEFVSMGSQNFTKNGRKSKEASMASITSFEDSEFLREIMSWKEDEQIKHRNTRYLEELLLILIEKQDEIKKLRDELGQKIEEIEVKHYEHHRKPIEGNTILIRNDEDEKLECRHSKELINWVKKKKNVEFDRCSHYPIINLDTKQMIFARVNASKISFVENIRELENVSLDDKLFDVTIEFSQKNFNESNVTLSLNRLGKNIELKYFFDGNKFEFKPNSESKQSIKVISELESQKDILYSMFKPFHAGIKDKANIGNRFAKKSSYKARIKIFGEVEIFSIKSIKE